MQTLANELRFHMQRLHLNVREVARRSGVHSSFIYDILSGKSANPSTLRLARVANALGISVSQLIPAGMASAGSPYLQAPLTPNPTHYLYPPRLTPHGASSATDDLRAPSSLGFGVTWLEAHGIGTDEPLAFCEICDDGMSPTLLQGDTVLIATAQREPNPPGLFVLSDNANLLVRRLEYVGLQRAGRIRINSDNPCYHSFENDLDETDICGRVVWIGRALTLAPRRNAA